MTYAYHWQKAITISVCLHIFLLAAAGYLTAGLTATLPLPEEVLLEMDLVSEPADRIGADSLPPEPAAQPDTPRQIQVQPLQAKAPVSEPEAAVTASDLTMTEAEPPAPATPVSGTAGSAAGEAAVPTGATAGGGSGSGIARPGILSKVEPVYPQSARQAGQEGTALLRIYIQANGRPGDIDVVRSSGYPVLDEAAVSAVRNWRFVPAKDRSSGKTVACTTNLPVVFRLNSNR